MLDAVFVLACIALSFGGVWLFHALTTPAPPPKPRPSKIRRKLLAGMLDRKPPQEPHP